MAGTETAVEESGEGFIGSEMWLGVGNVDAVKVEEIEVRDV